MNEDCGSDHYCNLIDKCMPFKRFNETCVNDRECEGRDKRMDCKDGRCACKDGTIKSNYNDTCLQGYSCLIDLDCKDKSLDSGINVSCKDNFCIHKRNLDEKCWTSEECFSATKYSFCNNNGTCICSNGFEKRINSCVLKTCTNDTDCSSARNLICSKGNCSCMENHYLSDWASCVKIIKSTKPQSK